MTLPSPYSPDPIIRRDDPAVHSVTSAKTPLSKEQKARTRRYLLSMTIRTVCFLGAIVAQGWLRWVLLAGAVVLPYIAVVMANAGRENDIEEGPESVTPLSVTPLEGPRPGVGH